MSTSNFPKLSRLTLREQVLEVLREAILDGTFPPGHHLAETDVAESYGISRGTVREALRTLEQARLVTSDSHGKIRVRVLSVEEIHEIFRVRAALEALAAEEIISSGRAESAVTELRELLPPPKSEEVSFVQRLNLDLTFHQRLCELSQNATLLETWRGLEDQMRVVMFSPGAGDPVDIMNTDHHAPLLEALGSEDITATRNAFFAHMAEASRRWGKLAS